MEIMISSISRLYLSEAILNILNEVRLSSPSYV